MSNRRASLFFEQNEGFWGVNWQILSAELSKFVNALSKFVTVVLAT
jgi:hypothetical protein